MKVLTFSHYGPPETLTLENRPVPEPGPGEVGVAVHATAINDWDWCYVRGRPTLYRLLFGPRRPKVHVLGAEIAGIVAAVGDGVTCLSPGDRVYGDVSMAGFGGFAEYACVPEKALAPMPDGMTFVQAAALPHAAGLAVQGLIDVGRLQQGERVLINGAGGGVGTLGLQVAKRFGAEVTGVDCGTKLELLRKLGFDHVIDYQREDFTAGSERYDLILDTKTTRSPSRYLGVLNPGGRYATVGGHVTRLLQVLSAGPLVRAFSSKDCRVVDLKPNKDFKYVNELFETCGLTCVIDGPHPLTDVPRQLQRFGDAEHLGKIVIQVVEA